VLKCDQQRQCYESLWWYYIAATLASVLLWALFICDYALRTVSAPERVGAAERSGAAVVDRGRNGYPHFLSGTLHLLREKKGA